MRRQVWALVAAASAVLAIVASATAEAPWREGVVDVDVATATASAESACPSLMVRLPAELIGDGTRLVTADSPFVQAWGDVPVILVCGAEQPTVPADQPLISMNGVMWSADMDNPTTTVWTTVDRQVPVQVIMPASTNAAAAIALSSIIRQTIGRDVR